ncbi:MAG: ECF transporter S component [Christensenellaceae bacterium]|jgi:thiamine transporter ThiT|nr:ECF transporter S component [Christensenellaceae bacterium]
MKNKPGSIRQLVLSALCLALCLILPQLFHVIPNGYVLSPMHIPVLLCGFLCGWPYALAVGFVAPFLSFALTQMPPLFPTGVAMAFELAAYGVAVSLLYARLPKKVGSIYASLLLAMLIGRVAWGLVRWLLSGLAGSAFTFSAFMSGAFLTALPAIVLHIVLVPLLVLALRRAGFLQAAA